MSEALKDNFLKEYPSPGTRWEIAHQNSVRVVDHATIWQRPNVVAVECVHQMATDRCLSFQHYAEKFPFSKGAITGTIKPSLRHRALLRGRQA